MLRGIWDPQDQDAQDAAWQVRDTPLWAAFSASFDPVVLGSDAEAVQRSIFDAMRPRPSGWTGAAAHAAEVLGLYQRAASDAAAFPGLVYVLHADPGDGRFVPSADDDLASRPGTALLPPGWQPHVRQAAWHYLHQGTPPGPDILDTPGQLPLTAQAGYLALAFLVRHPAPGGGAQLPSDAVLARWAPSVLLTGPGSDSPQGADPRQVLLGRLAGSPSAGLPALARRLIEGYLATRTWPFLLESVEAAWNDELAATLTHCLDSASAALTGFLSGIPRGPARAGQARGAARLSAAHAHRPDRDPRPARPRPRDRRRRDRRLRGHGNRGGRGGPPGRPGRRARPGRRRPAPVDPPGRAARRFPRPPARGPARPGPRPRPADGPSHRRTSSATSGNSLTAIGPTRQAARSWSPGSSGRTSRPGTGGTASPASSPDAGPSAPSGSSGSWPSPTRASPRWRT